MEGTHTANTRPRAPTPESQYSIFEYLYRDASNYKAWGALRLLGRASVEDGDEIRRHLEMGEYFVPELVGVPPLQGELFRLSDGPTDDDHIFHEFVELRPAAFPRDGTLPVRGTVEELIARFKALRSWPAV